MISKKAVLIAPDGGWGYMIVFGFTCVLGTAVSPLHSSFSIIFGKFLSEIGDGPSSVATVTSVFSLCFTFTGVLANPLIQKFPLRTISFFGATLFVIGALLNIFVTKTWHLVVTYGILSGTGFGIILPCILTSINSYFDKKRATMNSLAQLGTCPLFIALPMCFQYFMEHFGFRGTVAILAAYSANMFIAVAVMAPVENHARKEYELVTVNINGKTLESVTKIVNENMEKETKVIDENSKLTEDKDNCTINPKLEEALNNKFGLWQRIIHMFDLTLLHDWKFVNLIFGMAMFFNLDVYYLTMSPMFLLRRGFDPNQVAFCVTTAGLGDFCGRFTLTLISKHVPFKFWFVVLFASFLMFLLRIVFMIEMSYTLMLGLFFVTGFSRSYVHTPVPILFTERYNIERFPAVWGLYSVASGFVNIILGVCIGSVADYFKNDTYTMHTFTIISSVLITTWFIQAYLENRPKKQ
ncbi:monocarboxylate transporter 7-like [Chrysoperla carnea]|uniref:monocarboxylate transporter 7-like n=1 Tax=Chrysoperla carnea TaxID=189513 RepID=UPI001D099DDF|nr:monocarboxylate transporter 7-like [Chrysoperla carnea]